MTRINAEGLLVAPGLVDLIRRGVLTRDHTVVFIHTGGGVGNFAHPELF